MGLEGRNMESKSQNILKRTGTVNMEAGRCLHFKVLNAGLQYTVLQVSSIEIVETGW